MRRSMPDGTEDDLVTILTVKGVTKAEKAECLEEFRQNEWSVCWVTIGFASAFHSWVLAVRRQSIVLPWKILPVGLSQRGS